MGYARSKWVAENLVSLASHSRGIRAESLRIGQMVGDTRAGVWNETEAISLQLKGAQVVKAMPDLDEVSPRFRKCKIESVADVRGRRFPGCRSIWRRGQSWKSSTRTCIVHSGTSSTRQRRRPGKPSGTRFATLGSSLTSFRRRSGLTDCASRTRTSV